MQIFYLKLMLIQYLLKNMNKLRKNEYGFSVVELLVILIIVVVIGLVGIFVYLRHKTTSLGVNTPQTVTAATTTNTISSPDGKVSIKLPTNWHVVYNVATFQPGQAITNTTTDNIAHCLNSNDTNPCLYLANFQPTALKAGSLPVWGLSVEQSSLTPEQAADTYQNLSSATEEDLIPSDILDRSNNPIHGYDAYYVRYNVPGDGILVEYFISHDGYLAHMGFQETEVAPQTVVNASGYATAFNQIVNSLTLNY